MHIEIAHVYINFINSPTLDVEPTVPSSCRLEGAISERAISERVKLGGRGAISEREGAISERVQKW